MHDDIPSEPVKYEINPWSYVIPIGLSLWAAIESVVAVVKVALGAL